MNALLDNIIALISYPALACFMALILTRVAITVMPWFGMVDMPGGRHIHTKPTPKGGGFAIFIAFFTMSFAYVWLENGDVVFLSKFFAPAALLVLIGYFDDRYNLPARYKLLGQVLVGLLCWWLGFRISTLLYWQLPETLSVLVTVIWICGFVNAFNLIDGLDGLSAGLTIVAALCMTVWFIFDKKFACAVMMLILAGSCLGFLRYNFHPAKIFMGDVGSMFIGLTMAVIGMPTSKSITFTAVLVPLLAAGVPIFDVFLAIWRRMVKRFIVKVNGETAAGGGIMSADTNHLHHRILSKVKDTRKAAWSIYMLGLLFAAAAIVVMVFRGNAPAVGFIVVLLVFVVLIRRVATIEMWDSANLIMHGLKRPTQRMLLILLHPVYDLIALIISTYICMVIYFSKGVDYHLLIYTIAPVILCILISKNYRIFWLRADAGDYGYLVEVIFLGFVLALCFDYFFIFTRHDNTFSNDKFGPLLCLVSFVLQSFLFTVFLIVGQRLALRHLVFVFIHKLFLQGLPPDTKIPNTLIYGGGLTCRLLKSKKYSCINEQPHNVVGIIDDEPSLRDQYVYGERVYGGFEVLPEVCREHKVEKIILTAKLDEEKMNSLQQFCRENNISLSRFKLQEEDILATGEQR